MPVIVLYKNLVENSTSRDNIISKLGNNMIQSLHISEVSASRESSSTASPLGSHGRGKLPSSPTTGASDR